MTPKGNEMLIHETEELIKKLIDSGEAETGIFYCDLHAGFNYVVVDIESDEKGKDQWKFTWFGEIQVISALINEE